MMRMFIGSYVASKPTPKMIKAKTKYNEYRELEKAKLKLELVALKHNKRNDKEVVKQRTDIENKMSVLKNEINELLKDFKR